MPLRKEMIAVRHRTAALVTTVLGSTVLAMATATLALPAAASAAAPGVDEQITLPRTFIVGSGAQTVTAVVSSKQPGPGCRKVRWSMLLRVQGVSLDQVRVDRIENGQPFALRAKYDGDQARLTDVQFDPGTLCSGRTVTAAYRVSFSGGRGTATFQVDALDAANRVLQSATASSQVANEQLGNQDPATPPPARATTPPTDPSPTATDSGADGVAGGDLSTDTPSAPPPALNIPTTQAAAKSRTPSILGPGLIVGAVLVFLGVALLMRLRSRNRGLKNQRRLTPTSFYPTPDNFS